MNKDKQKIIIITGPTATGKTSLGVAVSKKLGGEVVSADSMQVYKYMNIGTAKPTVQEMSGIFHHMIDVADPRENYSVARYVKQASTVIDEIIKRGNLPVIVGGTGFYIDSLIKRQDFPSCVSFTLRRELEEQYDKTGGAQMLNDMKKFDETTASKLHENDKKRIVRAFEVYKTTGKPLSFYNTNATGQSDCYKYLKIALNYTDRAVLYDKINRRTDDMIKKGLVSEVSQLLEKGVSKDCTSMQAIGYKEILEVLAGNTDLNSAVSAIKQKSSRYAKRQMTWLRRDTSVTYITWEHAPDIERGAAETERLYFEAK